jgi:hypothetical protein
MLMPNAGVAFAYSHHLPFIHPNADFEPDVAPIERRWPDQSWGLPGPYRQIFGRRQRSARLTSFFDQVSKVIMKGL